MSNQPDFQMAYMDTCGPQTMLMIHGFPFNNLMWVPQYDDLYDMARIIAPDLPGHGSSDPMKGTVTMGLMAQQCADLLESLEIDEPIVVCGLSMGGYVAMELVRQFPRRISGLILTATRAAPDSEEARSGRNAAISKIKQKGLDVFVDEMLPNLFAPQNFDPESEIVAYVREMMMQTSPEGAIAALRGMKERADSRPLLSSIEVPTIIIHGEDDQIVPLAEAQEMYAAMPDSNLFIVENAGHLPPMEQPDVFNGIVAEFLGDLI